MSELETWDPTQVVSSLRAKAVAMGVDERLAEFEARERQHESEKVDAVLRFWGVPERYRRDIRTARDTEALRCVRQWSEMPREKCWCLILAGNTGVGKSVAATWWLSQVAAGVEPNDMAPRRWWSMSDLQRVSNYSDELDPLWTLPAIVLDDLGTEFNDRPGNFASLLYGIVEKRSGSFLRTIVTGNLNEAQFRARYDQRVYDRIRGGALFAGVGGQSLRRIG